MTETFEVLRSFELGRTGAPSEDAIRAYERDGVVCLRKAFSREWVEQGRRAVAAGIRTRSRSGSGWVSVEELASA